jgi:hypothetical protein
MLVRSRSRLAEAEYRFPVRLRLAVPPGGFDRGLDRMHAWLGENCGGERAIGIIRRRYGRKLIHCYQCRILDH